MRFKYVRYFTEIIIYTTFHYLSISLRKLTFDMFYNENKSVFVPRLKVSHFRNAISDLNSHVLFILFRVVLQ